MTKHEYTEGKRVQHEITQTIGDIMDTDQPNNSFLVRWQDGTHSIENPNTVIIIPD